MRRRRFLELGAVGAAGAWMSPFVPRLARAQSGGVPKRLLVIFSGLGYLEDTFWPTPGPSGRPDDFELGSTMSALKPFKQQLIYPDGLLNYGHTFWDIQDGNNHKVGGTCVFSASLREEGLSTGPSFDQMIADHLWRADVPPSRFRSISLGINGGTRCPPFHRASKQPITPQNSPSAAFDSLFGDFVSADDPVARERKLATGQSVLDFVRGDLSRMRDRIGRQESDVLDAHLEHIRALEIRLQSDGPICDAPQSPLNDKGKSDNEKLRVQMDLIAASFACDLTRVATLQCGHCDGGFNLVSGLNAHGTTHSVGQTKERPPEHTIAQNNHRTLDRAWADHWAYLLGKLDAIPDGDGSVLDNTLVVWGSDTTTHNVGDNPGPHRHSRFPYFMAGGGNFAFETGRYLKYEKPEIPDDVKGKAERQAYYPSHSRLFVSILQRFGIETETFGTLDVGTGRLPQLG
ncbi:MAG: DUF1552 domain-containing protein [Myxococcota bacterium]